MPIVVPEAGAAFPRDCLWIPKGFLRGGRPHRPLASAPQLMTVPTMRAWLTRLEASRRLAVVNRRVDPRFELTAVAKRLDGQAVWFNRVGDHPVPVVVGVASSRHLLADACGTNPAGIVDRLIAAEARPRACRVVPPAEAPVRQCTVRGDVDLLGRLPIPVHHE